MSMLDAFFNKGFKGARCKTLLKLTIPRLKLLRNRREIQLKQMRREIAKLLENGQEATARIRVEHIIREENMMGAQEIIELFCELIAVRLPMIETQRECPLDLKEAISSICFAAPRCSDLPELQQVQMLFAAKYGKEFVAAATELLPDCGVNRQIVELLSIRGPSVEAKLKLLKEIAEEHEIDWDPASSETEFLKPHEDLLNGPNHLIGGSTLPSNEKYEESSSSNPVKESDGGTITDADFDSLDLPEVPGVAVRTSSDNPFAPEGVLGPVASSDYSKPYHEIAKSASQEKDIPHIPCGEPKEIDNLDSSLASPYAPPNDSLPTENKQFIPFVSSPSLSSASLMAKQTDAPPSFPPASLSTKQSVTPPFPRNKSNHDLDRTSPPSVLSAVKQSEPAPSYSQTRCEVNVDLQDVLAAAQTAAETAERAARAARAAASLAQVRISALVTKRSSEISGSNGNQLQEENPQLEMVKKQMFDQQNSFGNTSYIPGYEPAWNSGSPAAASFSEPEMVAESPESKAQAAEHPSAHQPQRLPSLDDDPYFSYPTLFTSQDSGPKSNEHSYTESSKSTL